MKRLTGKPISPGYAEGTARLYDPLRAIDVPRRSIASSSVAGECRRLRDAIERAAQQLETIEQRVRAEVGDGHAAIFAAHLGLLHDAKFLARVEARIRDERMNAEAAAEAEIGAVARRIAALEDTYLSERAADVRDVGRRVIAQLLRRRLGGFLDLAPGSVVVAVELLPSDTVDMDRANVAAIVTEHGGENSHMAILARAMGVPAVTGIESLLDHVSQGVRVLVDGQRGEVTVTPSEDASRGFSSLKDAWDRSSSVTAAEETAACTTLDGVRIDLYANINRPDEAEQVTAHHLRGVGLLRTEFLFLDSDELPDPERQASTYRRVIEALSGLPVVIRTLDLGGDKLPTFLEPTSATNPGLQLRGLGFSLAQPELFEAQLRAIARAARAGDVRVLFPMVLGGADLRRAIEAFGRAAEAEGLDRLPPIGAMIETPSALFALEEILALAEFVSVGTNDLCQFMLAADRAAVDVLEVMPVLHPSVLRALRQVLDAARKARRPVCICGEAAGDPSVAALLAGLGARELSMSPVRAARVRYALRAVRCEDLERIANAALSVESGKQVHDLLRDCAVAV